MAARIGVWLAWPPWRSRICTGTWVTVQPARMAITVDSTVSPRYSAG